MCTGVRKLVVELLDAARLHLKAVRASNRRGLRFDEALEFNEGDVGLTGGIQVLENAHQQKVSVAPWRLYYCY